MRAAQISDAECLVTVAPPIIRFAPMRSLRSDCSWLVVQGGRDDLVDSESVSDWVAGMSPKPDLRVISDADHFFHGRLNRLRETVMEFFRARGGVSLED